MNFLPFLLLSIVITAQAATKEVAKVNTKSFHIGADVTRDDDPTSWDDALAFCKSNSMNLATIKNKQELDAVQKWLKTFGPPVFIGASDKLSEGSWYWQNTRSALTFNNWDKDEPQKGEYNSCAAMSSSNGKWRASYCDAAYAFPLCEKISNGRK